MTPDLARAQLDVEVEVASRSQQARADERHAARSCGLQDGPFGPAALFAPVMRSSPRRRPVSPRPIDEPERHRDLLRGVVDDDEGLAHRRAQRHAQAQAAAGLQRVPDEAASIERDPIARPVLEPTPVHADHLDPARALDPPLPLSRLEVAAHRERRAQREPQERARSDGPRRPRAWPRIPPRPLSPPVSFAHHFPSLHQAGALRTRRGDPGRSAAEFSIEEMRPQSFHWVAPHPGVPRCPTPRALGHPRRPDRRAPRSAPPRSRASPDRARRWPVSPMGFAGAVC